VDLPALSLAEWEDTRLYLQLVAQIVGKTRLKLHPPINHWWHATLYLCARGLTTGGIPTAFGELDITIDLVEHRIVLRLGSKVRTVEVGPPICDVYGPYLQALESLGIEVELDGKPFKCKSRIPFAQDHEHSTYDRDEAARALAVWSFVERPFKNFRGRFTGKCSPVHIFWHSFDVACTRFSGRRAPAMDGVDPVTQEAYSHEVISAGFWFGDDVTPEAAFYCYAAPAPVGLAEESLRPAEAYWKLQNGSPMALLTYEDVRKASDSTAAVLEFLQSSYEAGAMRAHWDRSALERA
jgi:hypothetical protein